MADPYITVGDPNEIALGFSISSTHIADLGIRPEFEAGIWTVEHWVIFFYQDFDIEAWKVGHELVQDWYRWIITAGYAEADCELFRGIALMECRGQALVEMRLKAFAWAYHRDMGDICVGECCRDA